MPHCWGLAQTLQRLLACICLWEMHVLTAQSLEIIKTPCFYRLIIICEVFLSWAAGWEWSESGRQAGGISPGCPPHTLSQRSTGTYDPPPWPRTSSPRSPASIPKKADLNLSACMFLSQQQAFIVIQQHHCSDPSFSVLSVDAATSLSRHSGAESAAEWMNECENAFWF